MMTIREEIDIVNAVQHITTANVLIETANDLLLPIAERAVACAALGDLDLIRTCLERFPQGFFRSELRTYCNKHGISL